MSVEYLYLITAHPPVVNITPLTAMIDEGGQVTFSCSATGLAANTFVYGWLLNGAPVRRQRNSRLVVTASEDTAGNYRCTVRNGYGGFSRSMVARLILSKCANSLWCFIYYHYVFSRPILSTSNSELYWIQCYME